MSAQTKFEMIGRVSRLVRLLEQEGMRIEIGDDFKRYFAYRNSQVDRKGIYPAFDVSQSYIDSSNGFWVCGFDRDDELIHTHAVRLLGLTGISLADHLNLHSQKYITPGTTPDPDQTHFEGPEVLAEVTGKVAYQGDFWLPSRGLGGPRSHGVTSLLSQLSLEMTAYTFDPDHLFAFVPRRLAEKGLQLRYGFSHCEIGSWIGPDRQITDQEYIIWMNRRELSRKLLREPVAARLETNVSNESVVSLSAGT